jgi:hypothetical protein
VSKSRTLGVAVDALYRSFADAAARRRWLDDGVVIRKAVPPRSLRLVWADGTPVEIRFVAKGASKSAVQVEHRGFPTKSAAEAGKASWHARLDALAAALQRGR